MDGSNPAPVTPETLAQKLDDVKTSLTTQAQVLDSQGTQINSITNMLANMKVGGVATGDPTNPVDTTGFATAEQVSELSTAVATMQTSLTQLTTDNQELSSKVSDLQSSVSSIAEQTTATLAAVSEPDAPQDPAPASDAKS